MVMLQVVESFLQNLWTILKLTESGIARGAEQGTNLTGLVVMVYDQPMVRLLADATTTVLVLLHLLILCV